MKSIMRNAITMLVVLSVFNQADSAGWPGFALGAFRKVQDLALGRVKTVRLNGDEAAATRQLIDQQPPGLFRNQEGFDSFYRTIGVRVAGDSMAAIGAGKDSVRVVVGVHLPEGISRSTRDQELAAQYVARLLGIPADKIRASSIGGAHSVRPGHTLNTYGYEIDASLPTETIMSATLLLEKRTMLFAKKTNQPFERPARGGLDGGLYGPVL